MAKVELETNTLAVLVAGMYCTDHQVDSMAIPQSLWIQIAEKLEYFLPDWDFDKISFEEWIRTHLLILPKPMLSEDEVEELQKTTLYWEQLNGNIILCVSMDIRTINGG